MLLSAVDQLLIDLVTEHACVCPLVYVRCSVTGDKGNGAELGKQPEREKSAPGCRRQNILPYPSLCTPHRPSGRTWLPTYKRGTSLGSRLGIPASFPAPSR